MSIKGHWGLSRARTCSVGDAPRCILHGLGWSHLQPHNNISLPCSPAHPSVHARHYWGTYPVYVLFWVAAPCMTFPQFCTAMFPRTTICLLPGVEWDGVGEGYWQVLKCCQTRTSVWKRPICIGNTVFTMLFGCLKQKTFCRKSLAQKLPCLLSSCLDNQSGKTIVSLF